MGCESSKVCGFCESDQKNNIGKDEVVPQNTLQSSNS